MSLLHLSELGFPAHGFRFKLGGSAPAQQIQSAPVPTPAPPVTQNDPAVIQAEHDLAQQNLLKKSVKKTILAGDTGGYMPSGAPAAGASPLKGKLG